jgi:hypothetical protein
MYKTSSRVHPNLIEEPERLTGGQSEVPVVRFRVLCLYRLLEGSATLM